jgi:hypothetical protein
VFGVIAERVELVVVQNAIGACVPASSSIKSPTMKMLAVVEDVPYRKNIPSSQAQQPSWFVPVVMDALGESGEAPDGLVKTSPDVDKIFAGVSLVASGKNPTLMLVLFQFNVPN